MDNGAPVEFSVRLPRKMHSDLRKLSLREYSSLNREIIVAVRAHLDADKQRRAGK